MITMEKPRQKKSVTMGAAFILLFILLCLQFACISLQDRKIETEITVSTMFRNYMVLQRDKIVPVWGTAQPGKTIVVTFAGQEKRAIVNESGKWLLYLDPMEVSTEQREMTIDYSVEELEKSGITEDFRKVLKYVLVGDVWFCSGQSNMAMGMSSIANRREELRDTNYPEIRMYMIPGNASPFALETIPSVWVESSRDMVVSMGWKGFSAVAYTFGRKLHNDLNVPIGLILAAYSGSKIHPWIPEKELAETPVLEMQARELEKADSVYKTAKAKDPRAKHPFEGFMTYDLLKPATTYKAMVHPVTPYGIKGILWYQGESNIGEGMKYADKLKALITGWRRVFNQGELPFYFAQIAPYDYGTEGLLPDMWEAQYECLSVPNTGIAISVDVGNPKDIHPTQKREIGERLALLALARTYGKTDVIDSGPVFKAISIEGNKAVITFDYTGKGLVAKDDQPLTWFSIAGKDMKFVPAKAVIEGDRVIVQSETVPSPVAVGYAWSNIANPNLFNKDGLPARPFRTDK